MTWIRTRSGGRFNYLQPEFVKTDIAHALSYQCRFNGHCPQFYSVAHHCVLVAKQVLDATGCERKALAALYHDGVEAYVGDLPYPMRQLPEMEGFNELEARLHTEMCFQLNVDKPGEETWMVDRRMASTERYHLFSDAELNPEYPRYENIYIAWEDPGEYASKFIHMDRYLRGE